MPDQDDPQNAEMPGDSAIFVAGGAQYDKPSRIVTLGHYYPQGQAGAARTLLREPRSVYTVQSDAQVVGENLEWTQWINALNKERQWPLKRFLEILDPVLAPDIAIAVVPTHLGFQAFWPVRTLAQKLAAHGRVDATACLVRHTTIRRIIFGGPSTRALHHQTIQIEHPERIQGRPVLLLDDIAKSGASLVACREMLYEAGAARVQAMALGRLVVEPAD